jgi:tetratricopeptide (TPR) repeat protein
VTSRGAALALALVAGCSKLPPSPDEVALLEFEDGERLFERGLYEEAIPHYEFVVAKRDQWMDAHHRLADCHAGLGREGTAVAVLEKARRVNPYDAETLRRLTRAYERAGRLEEAIGACRALVEGHPSDAEARQEMARLEGLRRTR